MKKTILLSMSVVAFMVSSCQKEKMHSETKITETIEVNLKQNETYTYVLPENQSDDPFELVQAPAHAAVSELLMDGTTGKLTYTYTPVRGFVGDDQVIIENVEESKDAHAGGDGVCGGGIPMESSYHADCNNGSGKGHHGHHDHECDEVERKIIINIHITGVASRVSQSTQLPASQLN